MQFQRILVAQTIADLQAAGDFKRNQLVMVLGGSSVGDGDHDWYYWDPASTATDAADTTGDVVKVTGQDKGRWRRLKAAVEDITSSASVTVSGHSLRGKTYLLNKADGITFTLPAATGSMKKVEFVVETTVTSNDYIVQAPDADTTFIGNALVLADGGDTINGYEVGGADDTLTMDGSTTGGIAGDRIIFTDVGADLWMVQMFASATGTESDPFSAAVS